mmetsp:Transcript_33518/g.56811  ORF Transcript_33518/g.56811 Transcript_33518/m.56811 type:complete len:348 (-) Transcript_33518:909-1952(-)
MVNSESEKRSKDIKECTQDPKRRKLSVCRVENNINLGYRIDIANLKSFFKNKKLNPIAFNVNSLKQNKKQKRKRIVSSNSSLLEDTGSKNQQNLKASNTGKRGSYNQKQASKILSSKTYRCLYERLVDNPDFETLEKLEWKDMILVAQANQLTRYGSRHQLSIRLLSLLKLKMLVNPERKLQRNTKIFSTELCNEDIESQALLENTLMELFEEARIRAAENRIFEKEIRAMLPSFPKDECVFVIQALEEIMADSKIKLYFKLPKLDPKLFAPFGLMQGYILSARKICNTSGRPCLPRRRHKKLLNKEFADSASWIHDFYLVTAQVRRIFEFEEGILPETSTTIQMIM